MTSNTNPDSHVAFSPQIITAQLDLILSSDTFADAPGLRQFLGYVVNETLSGRTTHIRDITIARDVFQRENPINERDSTIVRVEAGRLRRRLKEYYLKEGQQDPIHIRIPEDGYVPLFEGNATVTKEVIEDRPAVEPLRTRRRRFTRTGILGFIAIMLTLFALFRIFNLLGNENPPAGNSTLPAKPANAILPLVDATKDAPRVASRNSVAYNHL
jgi:hypothetical protein